MAGPPSTRAAVHDVGTSAVSGTVWMLPLSQTLRLMPGASLNASTTSPRLLPTSTVSRTSEPWVTVNCQTGRVPRSTSAPTTDGS